MLNMMTTPVIEEFEIEGLDSGIAREVHLLRNEGVQTYESCQGGEGHCYADPTIRFGGDKSEGFRALDIMLKHGVPVLELRRGWQIIDGEPVGPFWELILVRK